MSTTIHIILLIFVILTFIALIIIMYNFTKTLQKNVLSIGGVKKNQKELLKKMELTKRLEEIEQDSHKLAREKSNFEIYKKDSESHIVKEKSYIENELQKIAKFQIDFEEFQKQKSEFERQKVKFEQDFIKFSEEFNNRELKIESEKEKLNEKKRKIEEDFLKTSEEIMREEARLESERYRLNREREVLEKNTENLMRLKRYLEDLQEKARVKEQQKKSEIVKTPYEVLGVDKMAMKSEIKLAYRHLLSQYHPDKVNHLGDEIKVLAEKKTNEIIDAYNTIMKAFS